MLLGPDPRRPGANTGKGYDTPEKVAALRAELEKEMGAEEWRAAHFTTISLRRYLRARQGDVEKAAELARTSLRERAVESMFGCGLRGGAEEGRGGRGWVMCRRV